MNKDTTIIEVECDDYVSKYDSDEKDDVKFPIDYGLDEKLQFEQLNDSDIVISSNGEYIAANIKENKTIVWWIKDSGNKNESQYIKGNEEIKEGDDIKYTQGGHVKEQYGTISNICVS